jgi:hypothetical protein
MLAVTALFVIAGPVQASTLPPIQIEPGNSVPGCATPGRLMAYVAARNPSVTPRFEAIAAEYMRSGTELGVRWDYAFFQMIVDTASLTFRRSDGQPGSVSALQNNFAGLGAAGGAAGESFADVALGVRAHLQHLLVYAGRRIDQPVALRTRKIQDWGILTKWQQGLRRPVGFADLASKWAPDDATYGASIDSVGRRFYQDFCHLPDPLAQPAVARLQPPPRSETATADPQPRFRDGERSGLGAGRILPGVEPPQPASLGHVQILNRTIPASAQPPLLAPVVTPDRASLAAIPMGPPPVAAAADAHAKAADEAVRTLVSGKTVLIDAVFGASIQVVFRPTGSMLGQAGSLAYLLGAASDEGRWWIAQGRLCQRWKTWLDRETQCLRLREDGATIRWVRDDGKTGTARFAAR